MYCLYKLGEETREKYRQKNLVIHSLHSVVWQRIFHFKIRQACTADRSKHTVWKTLCRSCPRQKCSIQCSGKKYIYSEMFSSANYIQIWLYLVSNKDMNIDSNINIFIFSDINDQYKALLSVFIKQYMQNKSLCKFMPLILHITREVIYL